MTQRPLKTTQTRSAIPSTWPGYRVSSVASLWQSCHLLWQWHGESLGYEGDCDAFQEPKQEFFVSQNSDILCSHQPGHSALHLCCLSIQVTNSPAESFVSLQLLAIPMLLLPFKSSMLLDHSEASLPLGPISLSKKTPNAYPIMCVFATQLASPSPFPISLILVLITLNCFLGFLSKI